MLKNAFKKHPLQNRTNVQIKGGGGVKGLLNNVQKNCTFLKGGHPLCCQLNRQPQNWDHILALNLKIDQHLTGNFLRSRGTD